MVSDFYLNLISWSVQNVVAVALAESGQELLSMSRHQAQIAAPSWHGPILSSACRDGSIWHHVRIAGHKVMELLGHSGEVCGLKWGAGGELFASGSNDNVVNIWDGRVGDVTEGSRGVARWTNVIVQPQSSYCSSFCPFIGSCVVPL